MKEDLIFKCYKCGHELYTDDVMKLFFYDCPECGEEWQGNWMLIGSGVYKND